MNKLKLRLSLLCLSLSFLLATLSQAQSPQLPFDANVKVGKLNNGLTYYIQHNKKPEKRVELRLVVNAGSVQEDDQQLGMAHFVEHMCFNGTEHFPKNDLIHYLQSIGTNFGPEINGYTSFDETVYMLTVPSDSASIMDNAFQIMADWAHGVTFDPEEVEKERGVILEEWRLGRGADQRMRDKYLPMMLQGSKYADRLPIGTKESIENTSYDDIVRFYKTWYRPDLMAFIVVGDIEPSEVESLIASKFAAIPAPKNSVVKEQYSIDANKEPLISVVSDKENTRTTIEILYKTQSPVISQTEKDFEQGISRNLFCNMLNQRLSEKSREANPPFIGSGTGVTNIATKNLNAFYFYALTKEDGMQKGLETGFTELQRAKKYGFTQAELDRKKKAMLKYTESAYLDRENQQSGNLVWRLQNHFLKGEIPTDLEFNYEFMKAHMDGITLNEVNAWADKLIIDNNQLVIATGVEKDDVTLPQKDEISDWLVDFSKIKVEPYEEKVIDNNFFTKQVTPGTVVNRKVIGETGVTEYTLSNGLKVVLKPTDFKANEILMSAFAEGGLSNYPYEYTVFGGLIPQIVNLSGVDKYSKTDLDKVLEGKVMSVNPYISDIYSGFNGNSNVADFETMLQLTHLYFTSPRTDTTAFLSYTTKIHQYLQNVLSSPTQYFFNETQYIRYGYNPETPDVIPTDEDWKHISYSKMLEVYHNCFKNAADYTFMFVGSFDNETVLPLLEKYLGSLPSSGTKSTFKDRGVHPLNKAINEKVYKGQDPKSFVVLNLYGEAQWSKYDSHNFWSLCQILQKVYTDKLREEMSGVYGFSINGDLYATPNNHYGFRMVIPCAPENADKLVEATIQEIERMKKEGPTDEELQKEIESQRRRAEKEELENNSWLWKLNRIYMVDKEYGRIEHPYELCKIMTKESMKEVANKYFDLSKLQRITLYPETQETVHHNTSEKEETTPVN